jgi:hypothetical protein
VHDLLKWRYKSLDVPALEAARRSMSMAVRAASLGRVKCSLRQGAHLSKEML